MQHEPNDGDGDEAMPIVIDDEAELVLYFGRDIEAHPDASVRQRLDRVGPGIRLRNESGEEYSPVTLAQAKKACSKAVKMARVP